MTATLLLLLFSATALAGAIAMLVARHPMRVALGLIATMLSLACLYALLGVHVIAVFQVLVYVGAVMVFMVFVIMLLDRRDPAFVERYSAWLLPGVVLAALLAAGLGHTLARHASLAPAAASAADFRLQPFAAAFMSEYALHFELTSLLLVVAVVAAIAVIKGGRQDG